MIIVTIGHNANVEQYQKFAYLYQRVVSAYRLSNYTIDIQYKLPTPKGTVPSICANSVILDIHRLAPNMDFFSVNQQYVINNMIRIYNYLSLYRFDGNFTQQDMRILNKINKLIKIERIIPPQG